MKQEQMLFFSLLLAVLSASSRWVVNAVFGATFTFVVVSGALAVPWVVILVLSVYRYEIGRAHV